MNYVNDIKSIQPYRQWIDLFQDTWENPISDEIIKKELAELDSRKEISALPQNLYKYNPVLTNLETSQLKHLFYQLVDMIILDFKDPCINKDLMILFRKETLNFIEQALIFDSSLSTKEIYQGLRNLWIMFAIQQIMDRPPLMTPSAFAYSLLYPYTDNFLDSNEKTFSKKNQLCSYINLLLEEKQAFCSNKLEKKIGELVNMILREHQSNIKPAANCLKAINQAQKQSIPSNNKPKNILRKSLFKGGCSVVADGVLLDPLLTATQLETLFGFGTLLQFLDDLNDINLDSSMFHSTLFTNEEKETTEMETTRLLHYISRVLSPSLWTCFKSANPFLIKLIQQSCYILFIMGIAKNDNRFSLEYLAKIRGYAPSLYQSIQNISGGKQNKISSK